MRNEHFSRRAESELVLAKQPMKILIADDETSITLLLSRWLSQEGFDCAISTRGDQALQTLEKEDFAVLLSDLAMPGKSGMELLSVCRQRFPDLAVIMVSAVDDRKIAIHALQLGAFGYIIKPFERNEVIISVANALERRRLLLLSRQYQQELEQEVHNRTQEIRQREEEIALRLVSAAEYRDSSTGAHIRRIGLFSAALAEQVGWPPRMVDDMRVAAQMHDIGKIAVRDSILLKPGSLTPQETGEVRKHAEIGGIILQGSKVPLLQLAREIALSHHEKWDGSGYPLGLAGESIPESARIVALVDVYDALIHDRVYRQGLPEDEVIATMRRDAGTHFDPHIFEYFLRLIPKFREIHEQVEREER